MQQFVWKKYTTHETFNGGRFYILGEIHFN